MREEKTGYENYEDEKMREQIVKAVDIMNERQKEIQREEEEKERKERSELYANSPVIFEKIHNLNFFAKVILEIVRVAIVSALVVLCAYANGKNVGFFIVAITLFAARKTVSYVFKAYRIHSQEWKIIELAKKNKVTKKLFLQEYTDDAIC